MHLNVLKRRIVVIDDSPTTCSVLAACLRTEGYEVTCYSSGIEALEQLKQGKHPPDLMIVDAGLPWISGLDLTRRLHAKKHLGNARIIMLTDGSIFSHLLARLAGADFTLLKPVPITSGMVQILFEVIKTLL